MRTLSTRQDGGALLDHPQDGFIINLEVECYIAGLPLQKNAGAYGAHERRADIRQVLEVFEKRTCKIHGRWACR
jgi:hypothetical protein